MFNMFNTLLPHLENKELPVSYYWFGQKQGMAWKYAICIF